MKKIFYILCIAILMMIPNIANAEGLTDDLIKVSETTKYYKTITYYPNNNDMLLSNNNINGNNSRSIEISEEEYNNVNSINNNAIILGNGYVETNYKKMTTTIYQNGIYYRYQINLDWKTMPSTRSYDIIGIGYNSSVRLASSIYFNQYYCFTDGNCTTNYAYYPAQFSHGVGASFKLPYGSLSSLHSTLYFDVEKNVNATIISQDAYGDYSHATSSVTSSQSQLYTVSTLGINLDSSINNYYDGISYAHASWSGSW